MSELERAQTAAREFDVFLAELQERYGVVMQKTLTYIDDNPKPEIGLRFAPVANWQPKPDFAPEPQEA